MRPTVLGPIFGAEMLTSARRFRFFLTRAAYGTALLLILWWNYAFLDLGSRGSNTADLTLDQVTEFSSRFLFFFSFLQLWALLLVAPPALGGLIARERERRTTEFLFATDLSNRENVLGKFAAEWCYLASLLITGLPVLALVMMMGGIPPAELLAVFAVTLSTSVFVASLAMLVSVRTRRVRDGITQTYLLMLCVFAGPFLVRTFVLEPLLHAHEGPILKGSAYVTAWLMAINPFYILGKAVLGSGGNFFTGRGDTEVLELILGQSIGAGLALAVASASVRRTHLHAASVGVAQQKRTAWLIEWRPQVGSRAMLWKEMFIERVSGRRGTIARIGTAVLGLVTLALNIYIVLVGFSDQHFTASETLREQMGAFSAALGTIISCSMLLVIAVRASTSIATERDRDTWLSLISSPISTAEILWSKLAGSIFAIRYVLALLVTNWCFTLLLVPMFAFSVPFLAGTFTILAFAVASLGLFFSLWCRSTPRALMSTMAVAFTVGGGYYLCCGCTLLPLAFGVGSDFGELMLIALLAPLIPFLLGYPSMVGILGVDAASEATVPLAYLAGNGLYVLLGAGLLAYSFHEFEKLAGRVHLSSANSAAPGLRSDPVASLLRGANPPGTST